MTDAMRAETASVIGAGGDAIEAYLAQPIDTAPVGGVSSRMAVELDPVSARALAEAILETLDDAPGALVPKA